LSDSPREIRVVLAAFINNPAGSTLYERIGSPGDRGCVSCGKIASGDLVVDERDRYWCTSCALDLLSRFTRRVEDRGARFHYGYEFKSDEEQLRSRTARLREESETRQARERALDEEFETLQTRVTSGAATAADRARLGEITEILSSGH